MIVEFIEVGRNKKSWELNIDSTISVGRLKVKRAENDSPLSIIRTLAKRMKD